MYQHLAVDFDWEDDTTIHRKLVTDITLQIVCGTACYKLSTIKTLLHTLQLKQSSLQDEMKGKQ